MCPEPWKRPLRAARTEPSIRDAFVHLCPLHPSTIHIHPPHVPLTLSCIKFEHRLVYPFYGSVPVLWLVIVCGFRRLSIQNPRWVEHLSHTIRNLLLLLRPHRCATRRFPTPTFMGMVPLLALAFGMRSHDVGGTVGEPDLARDWEERGGRRERRTSARF